MNFFAVKTSRAGFLTCFVFTLFVSGCTDNGATLAPQNVEPDNTGAQGGEVHPSTAVHTYIDWSGTVEVTVYESHLQVSGQQQSRTVLRAQVTDSDGVCIGGGAWMERLVGNYNGVDRKLSRHRQEDMVGPGHVVYLALPVHPSCVCCGFEAEETGWFVCVL